MFRRDLSHTNVVLGRAKAGARLITLGAVAAGLCFAVFAQAAWADPKPPPPAKPCKPKPDHKPPKKPHRCPVEDVRLTTNATDALIEIPFRREAVIEDVASLHAGPATATGTLTFKVYSDGECTQLVGETTVAVHGANDVEYRSGPVSVFEGGVYLWTVSYSGGSGGQPVQSECGAENEDSLVRVLEVEFGTTNATDAQLDPLTHEAVIEDVVEGVPATAPPGTVTFLVYDGVDCAQLVGVTTVAVHGGAVHSGPVSVFAPGTYFWRVALQFSDGIFVGPSPCGAVNEESVVTE